ncbi:MAG: hypothetical protein LBU16_10395 [Treponema sp.]|jgi:predicted nuclease with TOPRIM domain|nr:hypothetical protein [Treponema sp.]
MVKRFLRLFREYRDLERALERETAFAESLNRYIEALEGRDREQQIRLEELEEKNRDALAALGKARDGAIDLRARLERLCPNHTEEEP